MTIEHLNIQGLGENAAGLVDNLEDKEIDVFVVLDVQRSWVDATGRTNRSYRVVRGDSSSAAWVHTRVPLRRVESPGASRHAHGVGGSRCRDGSWSHESPRRPHASAMGP